MLRGLYAANTAMVSQQLRETVISQNLANINTPGYKADRAALQSFPEVLLWRLSGYQREPVGSAGFGAAVGAVETDYSSGPLQYTGRPLDVAIAGEGYFVVQDAKGETFLSRNGALAVNADGYLVTAQGHLVLGEGGPVQVGGAEVVIREDGTVLADGVESGRLLLVDVPDRQALRKAGENLFRVGNQAEVTTVQPPLKVGYLEQANVDPVQSLIDLLAAFRAYEAAQRVLRAQDELLGRAASEVGTLR